jgi:hypothetical protein
MTTALEESEGSTSRPARPLPPEMTRYPLYRRLVGPQGRSGQVRKISPPPGFDRRTFHPVASRYTGRATRPTKYIVYFAYLLTYSIEQSPWEASWISTSREIPHILCNPKVHCRIFKCPPPAPILNQLYPVHSPTSHFLRFQINIILLPTPVFSKFALPLRFLHQDLVYTSPLPYTCHMPRPSFDRPINIGWGVDH